MRKLVLAALTMMLLVAVPMLADSFNPGDFTLGQSASSNGFVTPDCPARASTCTSDPSSGFYMQGADYGVAFWDSWGFPSSTNYFTTFASAGTVSFTWSAVTQDSDFMFDPFAVLLNGNSLLTVNNGMSASGLLSFVVSAGDVLEFQINSLDSSWGPGTATIDSYTYNVPEPGTLVLMATGVLGLAGSFRRRLSR